MRRLLLILSTIFLGTCIDGCMSALNYAHAAQKPAISVISTSVDEGTSATIQASRTGDLSRSSSVIFSTSNATAISGTNYTAKSGTLTFAPGASRSTSSSVITRRDGKVTGNLYFVVRLGVVSNAMIQANGTVTVRNLDQPAPPPAVVWTHCADEGETCYANGTVLLVRYGKDTTWSATFQETGPFACNNSLPGGDPLVGTVKECQIVGTPGSAPAPVQCPDGSTVPAGQTCPTPPPPVVTPGWVSAPLRGGGWARVVSSTDPEWEMTGPGKGRPLQIGEIVALYTSGWGVNYDGRVTYAIHAMSDGGDGRAYETSLEGIAPTGTPPALPADWYAGWLATAAKSCPDAFGRSGYAGITAGVQYRYTLWVGGRTKIAVGQVGIATMNFWAAPAADPYLGPVAVVTGDCLQGL